MKRHLILCTLLAGSALALSACDSGSSEPAKGSTKILDGKATIVFPEGFVKMPQDMLEKKYPLANRPKEAWYKESEGGKVSVAFSPTAEKIKESQISQFTEIMKQQFSIYKPVISEVTINGRKMGRMEMTTPSPDGNVFNVLQLSSVDDNLLVSTFNTTEDLKEKYEKSGKEVLSTLNY